MDLDMRKLRYADARPEWNAFWTFDPRPDGRRPQPGPYVRDMEEIVAYVRAGRGVAYLPVPVTAAIAPPGVVFVPVDGIPPGQVVLAWDADRPPRHLSDLISAAQGLSGVMRGARRLLSRSGELQNDPICATGPVLATDPMPGRAGSTPGRNSVSDM